MHIKTEEQSEKVRKALIARGVQMPQRMIAVKKQKEQMEYIKKPSLQGIEDRQVLEAMVWMIETVAPETVRKNKEQNAKLRKLVRAVEQWRNEIYSPINTKLPSPAQLKEKANKVHSLAVSMHSEFMSAVHKVVPYIHHALHTEQWEHADLRDRSGEAMSPAHFANWIAKLPTPPAPAWTNTRSPLPSLAWSNSPCHAVSAARGTAAASLCDRLPGFGATSDARTTTYWA